MNHYKVIEIGRTTQDLHYRLETFVDAVNDTEAALLAPSYREIGSTSFTKVIAGEQKEGNTSG